jgi:hypothetical protein
MVTFRPDINYNEAIKGRIQDEWLMDYCSNNILNLDKSNDTYVKLNNYLKQG